MRACCVKFLKRYCLKSFFFLKKKKKWGLLEVIKRCLKPPLQFSLFTKIQFNLLNSVPLATLHFAILWRQKPLILQKLSQTLACCILEMATTQRTRPRAVVGAPRRAAWRLKSALRHSVSAAPRTINFLHFFTIIAGDFLVMNNNG